MMAEKDSKFVHIPKSGIAAVISIIVAGLSYGPIKDGVASKAKSELAVKTEQAVQRSDNDNRKILESLNSILAMKTDLDDFKIEFRQAQQETKGFHDTTIERLNHMDTRIDELFSTKTKP